MILRRKYLFIAILIIASSLILTIWASAFVNKNSATLPTMNTEGRMRIPIPVTLNTIKHAENLIHYSLTLPTDTSMLGGAYRIIGAQINKMPQPEEYTGYDGAKHAIIMWTAEVIIWDKNFVNGTTTNRDILTRGGVVIRESPAPPGGNSLRYAQALLAPVQLCRTDSQGTVCETVPSGDGYIVSIKGFAVIVYPQGRTVAWLDDKKLRWIDITAETVGIDQLLALSKSMIP